MPAHTPVYNTPQSQPNIGMPTVTMGFGAGKSWVAAPFSSNTGPNSDEIEVT
jgi:hypothetical protein